MEQVKLSAKDLLEIWLKEREIQNQSKHTLQAYERDVADFLEFCAVQQLHSMMWKPQIYVNFWLKKSSSTD
jgi:Site-specific recombinase XerD